MSSIAESEVGDWYLVRTKPQKERWVQDQLKSVAAQAFLPLLRSRTRCFGKVMTIVKPLFPCYLFAQFNLKERYFDVKYTSGVHSLVSLGGEPVVVPVGIIEEIRCRGVDGVVELPRRKLDPGQKVRIIDGPFRDIEAIFDRYLSGSERVAILLDAIGASTIRVVLPSSCLAQ
jgi:transcriptional antiterminator RfaH